jgi:nicotinamide mononucleotide transporter
MTWPEIIGVIFGVLCVILTIRQSIWCWPTGLIQVLLFIWVFYEARLYSDFILHIIYAILQVYGWWHWLRAPGASPDDAPGSLKVTAIGLISTSLWVLTALIGTGIWGTAMAKLTDAAAPYPDAFLTVLSLIAQWLLTRKNLESWYFWIVVDITAVPLFASRGLYLTAGLYAVFLGLAIAGYFAWRTSMRQENPAIQGATP